MSYKFRTDDGEIVEVSWEEMMEKDCTGKITLKDGRSAMEVRDGWKKREVYHPGEKDMKARECVSDAMGFAEHQFEEFEADRQLNGFSGIEFERDPDVPQF